MAEEQARKVAEEKAAKMAQEMAGKMAVTCAAGLCWDSLLIVSAVVA